VSSPVNIFFIRTERGNKWTRGKGKNYALVKEREYNLIFSLLHRTLVSSEKLIHARSPSLVTRERNGESSLRARTCPRNQASVSPRKLVGSSVSDEVQEFALN